LITNKVADFMQKLKLDELNRLSVDDFKTADKTPIAIVLDEVRSALNVGSVFRTADAFACAEVILCGLTATPPHREIMKTALGSTESVAWRHFSETEMALNALRTEGYLLVAVEQADATVFLQNIENELFAKQNEPVKIALILGNEVDGVSEVAMQMANYVVEIPQFGTKHSLNIAVTAGIVVWEFTKRLKGV
jgi:23S rRNA (guanosine2251-2'-O)-methyltransferase